MLSSSRKPWSEGEHGGTQSAVGVPSVHWTLSCSARERDVAVEGGGGGRLAQRHRRLELPAVLPTRRATIIPERQADGRAAGVARLWGAAGAVLGWLVAALGRDLGGASGKIGGLAAPRHRRRAPVLATAVGAVVADALFAMALPEHGVGAAAHVEVAVGRGGAGTAAAHATDVALDL